MPLLIRGCPFLWLLHYLKFALPPTLNATSELYIPQLSETRENYQTLLKSLFPRARITNKKSQARRQVMGLTPCPAGTQRKNLLAVAFG